MVDDAVTVHVEGRPRPAPRPRGKCGQRAYYPVWYTAWKDTIGYAALKAMQGREPLVGPLAVDLVFMFTDRRKRGDIDNLAKAVFDGMQEIVFADDTQIVNLAARIVIDDQAAPGVCALVGPAVRMADV